MAIQIDMGGFPCPTCGHENGYHNDEGRCIVEECLCRRRLRLWVNGKPLMEGESLREECDDPSPSKDG